MESSRNYKELLGSKILELQDISNLSFAFIKDHWKSLTVLILITYSLSILGGYLTTEGVVQAMKAIAQNPKDPAAALSLTNSLLSFPTTLLGLAVGYLYTVFVYQKIKNPEQKLNNSALYLFKNIHRYIFVSIITMFLIVISCLVFILLCILNSGLFTYLTNTFFAGNQVIVFTGGLIALLVFACLFVTFLASLLLIANSAFMTTGLISFPGNKVFQSLSRNVQIILKNFWGILLKIALIALAYFIFQSVIALIIPGGNIVQEFFDQVKQSTDFSQLHAPTEAELKSFYTAALFSTLLAQITFTVCLVHATMLNINYQLTCQDE